MFTDDRAAHRTRTNARATQTPPAGTDRVAARPAVEGDPGSGDTPLHPLPGSAPSCWSCGDDASLIVAWRHRDRSTGREWSGIPRPSCTECADLDEAYIPRMPERGLHGPRVVGLDRAELTA